MRIILSALLFGIFCFYSVTISAAELRMHKVDADGHLIAVWEKSVRNPKGHILLHHGRTWSSLPDFDLQVEGEDLSLISICRLRVRICP
ncbi:MAG: hypothetical protein HKN33_05690 [Pyrinomonadaceae bacterium]|nr:hypothetical protein [Pyrinomonadaceae bacterium]